MSGDTSIFGQWSHKLTATGQVSAACDKIIHRMKREIALDKEMDKIMSMLYGDRGGETRSAVLHRWVTDVSGLGWVQRSKQRD